LKGQREMVSVAAGHKAPLFTEVSAELGIKRVGIVAKVATKPVSSPSQHRYAAINIVSLQEKDGRFSTAKCSVENGITERRSPALIVAAGIALT
jgi:hypothetical protein